MEAVRIFLPGDDVSNYDDIHRNRRNRIDDRIHNFGDELHNHNDADWEYYDPEALAALKKPKKSKRDSINIEDTMNMMLRGYVDPNADLYVIKPKTRNTAHEDSVNLVASKLARIRALEERLRHIDEMQMSLDRKIRKLQLLKEQETNTKMRIENEVSAVERQWKNAVERLKPGTYEPLDSLGDTSHIF